MSKQTVADLIEIHGNARHSGLPTDIYVHNAYTHRIYKRDDRDMHRRAFEDLAHGKPIYVPKRTRGK